MSIASRVLDQLTVIGSGASMTSVQLSKALNVKSSSLSSVVNKMAKRGILIREKGYGPRKGYGYRVPGPHEFRALPKFRYLSGVV